MQVKKSNLFLPLNICQRLLSFIINSLIPGGLKQVTSCHSLRQASTTVPLVAAKPSDNEYDPGFKIQVHHYDDKNDNLHEHEEVPILATAAQESRPTEVPSVRDVEEEERIRKIKGKSICTSEEMRLPNPAVRRRQVRPLFDVEVNINEKSDAFIRSRKEAMRRNYVFETKTF